MTPACCAKKNAVLTKMTEYSIFDFLSMPIVWIVVLLIVVIVQLYTRKRCVNIHLGGAGMPNRSFANIPV